MLPKYLLFVITWYSSYKKSDFWLYEKEQAKKEKNLQEKTHILSVSVAL